MPVRKSTSIHHTFSSTSNASNQNELSVKYSLILHTGRIQFKVLTTLPLQFKGF